MIRNLKAFGLALVAVFAMSAIASSAAQAELPAEFTLASQPAIVHGEQVEGLHTFTAGPFTVTCTVAKFTSETITVVKTPELTLTPTYENCHVVVGKTFPATVTMNGCDYIFTATKDKDGTYTAKTHIRCDAGKVIEVHIYQEAPHNAETSMCTLTIGPQTLESGITLTNIAGPPKDILAHINITNIAYTRHIGPKGNALTCGAASGTSIYKGTATLSATNGGTAVDASVSG